MVPVCCALALVVLVAVMGHFAQYRKRGGGSTGYSQPPPTNAQFGASVNTTHIQYQVISQPSGITKTILQSYLQSAPNAILETVVVTGISGVTGTFVYSAGQLAGVRAAWSLDGVTPTSPFSVQLSVQF